MITQSASNFSSKELPVRRAYLNSTVDYNGKRMLTDVVVLRLALIFLLVWTHLFAPFNGSWAPINGLETLTYPKWIVSIISPARMPGLIFVSGYLLGYTSLRKSGALGFNSLVKKKFSRLFIPSLVFSLIYYLCFLDISAGIKQITFSIVNGAGHLWFLPMLFWCFIFIWISERLNINKQAIIIISVLLNIIPIPDLPLRFNNSLHFFVYFYLGFALQRRYIHLENKLFSPSILLLLISAYLLIFLIGYNLHISPDDFSFFQIEKLYGGILSKIASYACENVIALSMGVCGIFFIYLLAHILIIPRFKIPSLLIMLSSYCYGVYIYHQFILRVLYYKTPIVEIFEPDLIVWLILPLTIFISLILTHLTLKTKIGRRLIG